MQKAAENALVGKVGSVVVLNPTTGAVLAKASSPSYEYNDVPQILSSNDSSGELVDRSTQVLYTPGSTFKTITLAAALDTGQAKLDDSYGAPASMDIGGAAVTNIDNQSWNKLTLKDALANSANTVFGQLGTKIGAQTLVNYAKAFGYDTALGSLDRKSVV